MIILPAIDIKDGKAVRLYQGDFSTAEKVADDIIETAKHFEICGAEWIHVVDLDGAYEGHPVNKNIIKKIINETSLNVEIGGGIRSMDNIDEYIELGAKRVILGSVALSDPELVKKSVAKYKDKIAVGIDAGSGIVKSNGWTKSSNTGFLDLAAKMDAAEVKTIIYTDIERDGTLKGPNTEDLELLSKSIKADIIASGGVSSIDDLSAIDSLGIYGAIVGKAIYSGDVDLIKAIDLSHK